MRFARITGAFYRIFYSIAGGLIVACLCLSGGVAAQVASGRPSAGAPPPMSSSLPSKPVAPAIRATAGIVVDGQSGAVLWAKEPDRQLPPASTTKIATGLLLARDLPPTETIVASANAARTSGHDLEMQPGERFTARALLHALMLISANDASVAVAERMAGSEPAFANRMNGWAHSIGAHNTHFVNASGLPAPAHYSTARDLATMARKALANPTFAAVVRTRTYAVPRSNGRPSTPLRNENRLLWTYPGTDGVKAGWTEEAGNCFVGSATRGGQRIITVLLHSPNCPQETAALLDYGFARLLQSPTSGTAAIGNPTKAPSSPANVLPGTASRQHQSATSASNPPTGSTPDGNVPSGNELPEKTLEPGAGSGSGASVHTTGAEVGSQSRITGSQRGSQTGSQKGTASGTSLPAGSSVSSGSPTSASATEDQKGRLTLPSIPLPDIVPPSAIAGMADIASGKQRSGVTALQEKALTQKQAGDPGAKTNPAPPIQTVTPRRSFGGSFFKLFRLSRYWIWWLISGLIFMLACWLAMRRGSFGTMSMPDFLVGLFGKRRPSSASSGQVAAAYTKGAGSNTPTASARPGFSFVPPMLVRRDAAGWLESILDTPSRLLDPAIRRQALAVRETDPRICEARVMALLTASSTRTRIVGMELVGTHSPRVAEENLLAIIKDEQVSGDARVEAVQLLAELGGDRHERLWLQMLLRDGTAAAGHALARLPRLEDSTAQALQHVLATASETREAEGDLKRNLRNAQIACVLLMHGHFTRQQVAPFMEMLPASHGEPILVATLRGTRQQEGVDCLVDLVLHGHAYPALQALMECDPRQIRTSLAPIETNQDRALQTRALILKWLTLGEGNPETLQGLANAGNDLARGALQLGRLHRWEGSRASTDTMLAAAQIYSLRLGFSQHAQEEIALAFRKAATDGEAQSLAALPEELQPLAQAYAHPDVYEAVQVAMHTDDGLQSILATLSRHPETPAYRQEMAFWCDKMPRESRLMLTHSLSAIDAVDGTPEGQPDEQTHAALASRATDSDPLVRTLALRWLHAHPLTPAETQSAPLEALEIEETTEGFGAQESGELALDITTEQIEESVIELEVERKAS